MVFLFSRKMKTKMESGGRRRWNMRLRKVCCGEGEGHTVMQLLPRFGDEEKGSFRSSKG